MATIWNFDDVIVESITDGDTYKVFYAAGPDGDLKRKRVRLFGVNCPEKYGETKEAGLAAKAYAENLLLGQTVSLVVYGIDSFGRFLSDVVVGGIHVGQNLLENGHAVIDKR